MRNIFFVGIGGIGMSAIARFFLHEGKNVAGYDRTQTPLTMELERLGAEVCYSDEVSLIPDIFHNIENTLVVYTPAIPSTHSQLNFFFDKGYRVIKRSKILGEVTKGKFLMAVAGTHGKSSTTTLLSYLNHTGGIDGTGSAFLGAISKNFETNMVLGSGDRVAVEADEFDRSFLQLYPDIALITSVDADHLDIYGNHETMLEGFTAFTSQIKAGGTLIYRHGIPLKVTNEGIKIYTYSYDDSNSDFYAKNISKDKDGLYTFSVVCADGNIIEDCHLGIAGRVNVENAIGAISMMWVAGFDEKGLKEGLRTFSGLRRRFDVRYRSENIIYIDDYAHHPSELAATIGSVRDIYPERKITAIFQPHLFTRTRDFVDGFAATLSTVDKLILLPIYPAREEPIEGVSTKIIFDRVTLKDKIIVEKSELIDYLKGEELDILISFGAGDIDTLCEPIEKMVRAYETV